MILSYDTFNQQKLAGEFRVVLVLTRYLLLYNSGVTRG